MRSWRWSIPLLALATAGCQFKAVQAAGAVGEKLAGHSAEFNSSVAICYDRNWIAPEPKELEAAKKECDAVQQNVKRWEKIAEMLAAYANKLSTLAKKDDLSVKDQVSSVLSDAGKAGWSDLKKDEVTGISTLAGLVVQLLSQGYRDGVLEDTINKTDEHVQVACAALIGGIDLQIKAIDAIQYSIDFHASRLMDATKGVAGASPAPGGAAEAAPEGHLRETRELIDKFCAADKAKKNAELCAIFKKAGQELDGHHAQHAAPAGAHTPAGGPEQALVNRRLAQASIVGLNLMKSDLASKRDAWENLGKMVASFQKAHGDLKAHVGDLKSDELLASVIKDIQTIVNAVGQIQGGGAAGGNN